MTSDDRFEWHPQEIGDASTIEFVGELFSSEQDKIGFVLTLRDNTVITFTVSGEHDGWEQFGVEHQDHRWQDINKPKNNLRKIDIVTVPNKEDSGYAMFIRIFTNKNVFTITVYNWHNGWYDHAGKFTVNGTVLYDAIL